MKMNMDVVVEILVRLPIKDIIRSKLVCKSWKTLISSPEFAKYHLQHQRHDIALLHVFALCRSGDLLYPYTFKIEPSDFDTINNTEEWWCLLKKPADKLEHKFNIKRNSYTIGSCNGLICFVIVGLKHTSKMLCLWNPAIHERRYVGVTCISKSWVILYCGFGYDSIADDYKIILLGKQPTNVPFARIFTLRTNKWRRVLCPSDDAQISAFFLVHEIEQNQLPFRPVVVGETLYWAREDAHHNMINPDNNKLLLVFNVRHESFEIVRLPNPHDNWTNNNNNNNYAHNCVAFFICQVGQSLCACWEYNELPDNDPRGPWLYLECWILEDGNWKFLLKLRGLERFFRNGLHTEVLPKLFELKDQGKFLLADKEFHDSVLFDSRGPCRYPPKMVWWGWVLRDLTCIFDYTPSLVSPTHHVTMTSST